MAVLSVPLRSEERENCHKYCQHSFHLYHSTSHLYGNTPPIRIAVLLEKKNPDGCGHRDVPHVTTAHLEGLELELCLRSEKRGCNQSSRISRLAQPDLYLAMYHACHGCITSVLTISLSVYVVTALSQIAHARLFKFLLFLISVKQKDSAIGGGSLHNLNPYLTCCLQVKNRMTAQEFVKNNRGIDTGKDLPEFFLRCAYNDRFSDGCHSEEGCCHGSGAHAS